MKKFSEYFKLPQKYALEIVIDSNAQYLFEHSQYKKFKSSTDLMTKHPENVDIPVKGHFHIVDAKTKVEIYAVNFDGTAHHKKNRGYKVPKRQADELRKIGVTIPENNILECIELDEHNVLNEVVTNEPISIFIIIEEYWQN